DLAARWTPPALSPDDLAALQYTSGSTGDPKGVMLTHRCVLHNLERMRDIIGLCEGITVVCWLPFYHDMGLIGNLLQAVLMDGHLVLMSPNTLAQNPYLWLQTISRTR